MKKICIIGHFDWRENHMIGATVKARNINQELEHQYGKDQTGNVDIYEWRKRKVSVFFQIIKAFFSFDNIVLVCSDTSVLLMRLFSVLKAIFNNRLHYCVVGGDIADRLNDQPERIEPLKCVDYFWVETIDCVMDLKKLGITNVEILRNFKCIKPVIHDELISTIDIPYRFCTFSRVIEQKGITDAMLAIDIVNKKCGRDICVLDIYGPIDESYSQKFKKLIENYSSSNYCGVIDSNHSVGVLKKYYCLLFPTKYQTEGIPGTIVDGFASGLPVICSDWSRCRQLVTDGKNGIIYSFDDFEGLVSSILFAIHNPEYIMKLIEGCIESYSLYQPQTAIAPLLKKLK